MVCSFLTAVSLEPYQATSESLCSGSFLSFNCSVIKKVDTDRLVWRITYSGETMDITIDSSSSNAELRAIYREFFDGSVKVYATHVRRWILMSLLYAKLKPGIAQGLRITCVHTGFGQETANVTRSVTLVDGMDYIKQS